MIDGVTVEAARQALGWSRRELAERCGMTEASLYTMEKRGRQPKPTEKVALAAAFGWDYHGRPLPQPMPEVTSPPPEPGLVQQAIEAGLVVPSLLPTGIQTVATLAAEHEKEVAARVFEPFDGERREPAPGEPVQIDGPVHEEGVRLISHSELRDFKACRRRWWLGWHRGLKPKVESPFGAMAVGNRIHQALAHYYTPGGVDSIDPATALEMIIMQDWTKIADRLGNIPEARKQFDSEANLERAMITGYVEWLANTGADADLEIIAPETYVEHSLGAVTVRYDEVRLIGRLDVRARRITDGSAMFIDHKTVANFTEPVKTLQLDEQMLHYHLLERRGNDLAVVRADGALYNMLRRVKRTAGAKPPFYQRTHIRHNDHEITSYEIRTLGTIDDIMRVEKKLTAGGQYGVRAATYPRPSRECSWCPFFEVCPMFDDGSRAEAMIEARYDQGDPLDYYRQPAIVGPDQGTEETG